MDSGASGVQSSYPRGREHSYVFAAFILQPAQKGGLAGACFAGDKQIGSGLFGETPGELKRVVVFDVHVLE